ncbi:MAG TPA: YfhO family protein [Bacteroidales bacterium]|nr:YfhO family protein [Bacteroidales bacterium]
MKNRFKKIVPHIAAVIVFIILSYTYFYPVLEGKQIKANDTQVHKINSKEIQDYRGKYGKEPLWTNSIFSGMPAYQISTLQPGNIIDTIVDKTLSGIKIPVSVLFVSLLGFYILLVLFGLNPWLAITGALAYGFTSFFFQVIAAGHNTQAIALSYMPPMIGSVWYAYRKNAFKGAILTAVFLTLQINANHPQITYYAFLCLLVFGIVELIYSIRNDSIAKFLRVSVFLVLPVLVAIGINFASLYTTWEYSKYSSRGKSDLTVEHQNQTSGLNKDYITYWSYGIGETFNLLIPNLKGGSSHAFEPGSETEKVLRKNNAADAVSQMQAYWGTQPGTEGPHYVGAVVLMLFVLGLFIVKGPEKWWLVAATILSLMLAWGKNLMFFSNLFIEFFPAYNKFRAVTMTLVIAEFCIPLLGFLALREIINGTLSKSEVIKKLKTAAAIIGGLTLLFLIIPKLAGSFRAPHESTQNGYPQWLLNALVTDRMALLRADAFRSLIFILLTAGIIWAFLKERINLNLFILGLGLLIIIDLWPIDKRYLNNDRFIRPPKNEKVFTPTLADEYILKDPSINRVLNLSVSTFNDNSPTSYFHHSIGGYHGVKMKRYQELIDSALTNDMMIMSVAAKNAESIEDLQKVFDKTKALNMLNGKYVIIDPNVPPLVNEYALGNAWFASRPVIVENANEEISLINKIEPANEVIIDKTFTNNIKQEQYPESQGDTIYLESYEPNELKYKYSSDGERIAVFSEIYYPKGWKAFIDGKEADHFRADYVLRAMLVPAGDHEIRFSFEPASYYIGNKISLASSLLLLLAMAGYVVMAFVKKDKNIS